MTQFVNARPGVRIAFERSGQGPALVLMHGAEASRTMFSALVPLLTPHFSVISYDQRDCGETEAPATAATLADLAHDVADMLAGLDIERAHVFGSSFGGRVAQAFAILHPQALDRLVLGSTWPLPHRLEVLYPGILEIGALRQRLPESADELVGWFYPPAFLKAHPELRGLFAGVQAGSARSQRRAAAVGSLLESEVEWIRAPTLLLAGDQDRVVPLDLTLSMAQRIDGAEMVVLPGVGHATALQAPDQVAAELIRFLVRP